MNLTPVISLDYLLRDKLLIWADAGETLNGIPGSINFYHNETQNWKFDLPTSSDVAAIAVDWVSRMIYWSDGTEDQISVCNIEGHYCKPVVYDRLKIKRGSFLQIDSLNGRLYFDNQESRQFERTIIESVSLDGGDRKMLIGPQTNSHRTQEFRVRSMKGMVVATQNVFLSANNTLFRISIENPSETQTVYVGGHVGNIGLVSYSDGYIYWLEEPQHLTQIHAIPYPYRGETKETTKLDGIGIYMMRAMSMSNQPLTNSEYYQPRCDEKKCSHLCLRKSNYPNVACACPAGIQFKVTDGLKSTNVCNSIPQKLMVIPGKGGKFLIF